MKAYGNSIAFVSVTTETAILKWLTSQPENPPTGFPEGTRSNAFFRSTKHMWTGWANSHALSKDTAKSLELVHCYRSRTKTTLFFLNLGFDYPAGPPLQYAWIDLHSEAEKCDPPIVRTQPPGPLFKKRDHHPSLPIQWHLSQCPRNVAESCHKSPTTSRDLKNLAAEDLVNHLGNFRPTDRRANPRVPSKCFLTRMRVGRIEEAFKVFPPPIDNIIVQGQQHTIPTVQCWQCTATALVSCSTTEAWNMAHVDSVEVFPGLEVPSDWGLCQELPLDPHNTFGSAGSHRHPPPPLEQTHHQVVVVSQFSPSFHPSVLDMRLQIRRHD